RLPRRAGRHGVRPGDRPAPRSRRVRRCDPLRDAGDPRGRFRAAVRPLVIQGGRMDRLRYDEDKAFLLADDAATIARIVRTVPAARLRSTKIGDWTALEVIGHVADSAEIFADRGQRCQVGDNPPLRSYDPDSRQLER